MDEATLSFHHFTRPPFGPAEAVDAVFLAASQTNLAIRIVERVRDGDEILAIKGPAGSGKTVLMHLLATMLRESGLEALQITRADRTPMQIHARIAAFGGLKDGIVEPGHMLQVMLTERGLQRLVVLVDDADELAAENFRYLWALLELRFFRTTQVHLVLLGQPGQWPGLLHPDLECLSIATATSETMPALDHGEAAAYLDSRLQRAGRLPRRVISRAARNQVVAQSHGLPGRIDDIMNTALARSHAAGRRRITPARLHQASDDDSGAFPAEQRRARRAPAGILLGSLAALACAAAAVIALTPGARHGPGSALAHSFALLEGRPAHTLPPAPKNVALAALRLQPSLPSLSPAPAAALTPKLADLTVEPPPDNAAPAVAEPSPRLPPGLAFPAAKGDSLRSLYVRIYRGVRPPPYAVFAAANPAPLKAGTVVFFPDPPQGWAQQNGSVR